MTLQEVFGAYRDFTATVDALMARVAAFHHDQIQCRPGCADCCRDLSLLPLEAAMVRQACNDFGAALRGNEERPARNGESCPLLTASSLCAVYDTRPLICRTHGLPAGYIDADREMIEISACPVNFPDEYPFHHEGILIMDPLIEQLHLMNSRYAALAGVDPWARVAIAEIIG